MSSIKRKLERGQGLATYALILVLVAVVVIVILTVFGEETRSTYCKIVYAVDPEAEAPGCDTLEVNCIGPADGSTVTSPFTVEAQVTDTQGDNNVEQVVFSLDGSTHNTENVYRYCYGGGDSSCQTQYPSNFGSGEHTITAVAHDADGNTGKCSITFYVP